MPKSDYTEVLQRIQAALHEAKLVFSRFTPGEIEAEYKAHLDPVTEADRAVDAVLRKSLLRAGEGWLSEESKDDLSRLSCEWVWVVDPLDGTREFVEGIPEFCVSIAMVQAGRAIAAGICNPASNEVVVGARDCGVTYNGAPVCASERAALTGAVVLASRSETKRGEWQRFMNAPFRIRPTGSVAYKLALVAAGLADATFTLTPKHEWDVAAGVALVESAGGFARPLDQKEFVFNQKNPLLPGLVACGSQLRDGLLEFLELRDRARTHS